MEVQIRSSLSCDSIWMTTDRLTTFLQLDFAKATFYPTILFQHKTKVDEKVTFEKVVVIV